MRKPLLAAICIFITICFVLPVEFRINAKPEEIQSGNRVNYTVEFTYDDQQYILPGESSVELKEILDQLNLSGEVTDVECSNPKLFSASMEGGKWVITSYQAFKTQEYMKVTANDVVYEIIVTDTAYDYTWFNQKIDSIRIEYYEGRSWSNSNYYPNGWYGCWAFANIMADSIFGYRTPGNSWTITDKDSIVPGDIIRTSGHTMFVIGVDGDTLTLAEGNYGYSNPIIHWGRQMNKYDESFTVYHAPNYDSVIAAYNPEVRGSEMSQGYDRILPDGDYLIATAASSDTSGFYYLDIRGSEQPATNEANVSLCGSDANPPAYDVWTIEYNANDKFYSIKQYGTNMSLDVQWADTLQATNVQTYIYHGSAAQRWAISHNGTNGYRLQPQCSGAGDNAMCLDIENAVIANGTNVRQYKINNTDAQSWLFIPYQPAQPIEEGRYVILYTPESSHELDIDKSDTDTPNYSNVQLWDDGALSRYNSFDFIKLANGYYKIRHVASGKCLDVIAGANNYKTNVQLFDDNGTLAQQWAIVPNGSGYSLISRCNGYALDLPDGWTGNGNRLQVYPRWGNNNQRWTFAKAEYTVSYDVNGGEDAPSSQIKYYKENLALSTSQPVREGCCFLGWGTSEASTEAVYQPGDPYSTDADLALYAVWERAENRIVYDANGGTGQPQDQRKLLEETVAIPEEIPERIGYTFLGWAASPDAKVPEYQPGDPISGDADLILYAVWKITNPPILSGADICMLLGDTRDWHDFVQLSHDGVLSYTMQAEISGSAASMDETGHQATAVSTGTAAITISIVECPEITATLNVRVLDLGSMASLPSSLKVIEEAAYENSGLGAVKIPLGCESIGQRAFAGSRSLVFAWIPASVSSIGEDAFAGCPGLTIYCYEGSAAHEHAVRNGIRYTLVTDGWIPAEDLPVGASIMEEKWTYTKTIRQETTSTESSLEGWSQDGYTWQQTGTGTHLYGDFPAGYDAGNHYYNAYSHAALANSTSGNAKREVSGSSHSTYVYWHWCWMDQVDDSNRNVLISDKYGEEDGKNYIFFDAFETETSLNPEGMTRNGLASYDGLYSTYHHPEYNLAEYGSWWWHRIDIRKQTYTDYQKLYSYYKILVEECESGSPVEESDEISNVKHWVRYGF